MTDERENSQNPIGKTKIIEFKSKFNPYFDGKILKGQ